MAEETNKAEKETPEKKKKASTTKKSTAKKPATKKSTAKKPATKKSTEKEVDAKDSAEKKSTAKKTTAKKRTTTRKTSAKKSSTTKKDEDAVVEKDSAAKASSPSKKKTTSTKKKTSSAAKTPRKKKAPANKNAEQSDANLYPEEAMTPAESVQASDTAGDAEQSDAQVPEAAASVPESSTSKVASESVQKKATLQTPEDVIAYGIEWLNGLYKKMNLDVDVEGDLREDEYHFNVMGKDAGLLLGRSNLSPKSIHASQTMLAEVLGEAIKGKQLRVDVANFQQKRQAYLADVAEKLGQTAKRVGRTITVAGFNAFERRIIHQQLGNDQTLKTESCDQGIFRKLKIGPK